MAVMTHFVAGIWPSSRSWLAASSSGSQMAHKSPTVPISSAPITLGFVPLVDAAPLIVAKEFGIFAAHGLNVELSREPGWATVRDKLSLGRELDGAHSPAGLAFAITYGMQCVARHCLTGLVLNRHGNGVTFSKELWERGVRGDADLKDGLRGADGRKLRFGIVHPASSHHFLLRSLFGRQGIKLSEIAEVIVLPPELMAVNLEREMIDGFCAGEPWSSVAIADGSGFCLATSEELCDSHPEKVLLVKSDFAEQRHEDHLLLIAALLEACAVCDDPKQRPQIAKLLSSSDYLDIPFEIISNSLCNRFHRGFEKYSPAGKMVQFSGEDVNCPSVDHASLVLSQLRGCDQLPSEAARRSFPKSNEIFRSDLYDLAKKNMSQVAAVAV